MISKTQAREQLDKLLAQIENGDFRAVVEVAAESILAQWDRAPEPDEVARAAGDGLILVLYFDGRAGVFDGYGDGVRIDGIENRAAA